MYDKNPDLDARYLSHAMTYDKLGHHADADADA
jgi:hypothetical protein